MSSSTVIKKSVGYNWHSLAFSYHRHKTHVSKSFFYYDFINSLRIICLCITHTFISFYKIFQWHHIPEFKALGVGLIYSTAITYLQTSQEAGRQPIIMCLKIIPTSKKSSEFSGVRAKEVTVKWTAHLTGNNPGLGLPLQPPDCLLIFQTKAFLAEGPLFKAWSYKQRQLEWSTTL